MKRRRQSSVESEDLQAATTKKQKRRKESHVSDPWDVPPELYSRTELCHKLYDAIRSFKGPDNQPLCEFVVRLPNRRSVPEYYKIVTHPIDLLKIQQKLKTDEYVTVPLFVADVRLLIDNSKLFYMHSSVEFKRTCALEKEFLKVLQELCNLEDAISPLSPKTVSLKLSSLGKTPVPSKPSSVKPSPNPVPSSSKRLSNAGKTTRSKAWLDEYISSGDPIKIYFADIFSYHDGNGDYVSQPFIDLPSAKEYPEYYRIITEPIGLAVIKNNIESGRYKNLKDIQEDLLLMIKNAQYFNEPLSDIHKMATTLRKVIINRCVELERKYKTVERTTKLQSPDSKNQKLIDNSDSEDTSCSDSDGAESEDVKKRLLLHIKRESLHLSKDPLANILKLKSPPSLKKTLLAVYRTLTRATDDEGRVISELFIKRPSAKLYPEYYIVIKSPIDFKEISVKIKKHMYKSFSEMMTDIELLVNNAITFNEEYSQIHSDALTLKAMAQTAADQLQAKWPLHFNTGDKKVDTVVTNSITTLFAVVKNCIDSTGRKLWLSLKDPPQFSKGEAEGYVGKKIGLGIIAEKIDSNNYGSIHEVFSDLCLVYDCYCESVPSHSPLFKDALSLHRITVSKYNELTDEQHNKYMYPNAPELLKKLLKDLMVAVMEARDSDGHTISETLQNVTVTQDYNDDSRSKRILSFDKINQWVMQGRYARLDQLQKDILLLFQQARLSEADSDNESEKIIVLLEKEYVRIRDKICSSLLWSPAYEERTLQHIEDEENEEDGMYCCKQDDQPVSTAQSTIIPPVSERTPQKFHMLGEITYFIGDFVYLPPREQHLPPQIALIESLWTDTQGNPWFDGCWFFRPHETYHVASRKFYEQEVFKSDFYSSAILTSVIGKCYVLYIKEYTKSFPQGFSEEDVYVCESRYMHKAKSIKKIKFWNVQENSYIKLLPRLTQCSLNKVPSVFVNEDDSLLKQTEQEKVEKKLDETKCSISIEEESDANSSGDSLEISFFRELKDVKTTVTNPEENCTYYEQYCIDEKVFKLGDFVYVRSDQDLPFIARIDQMWTDSNDDPWFRGPWFLRVEEVQHLPSRMFYERELFMSNIHDSNPMRSIMRKCAVMYPTDYIKWRVTEIPETDVYVCESKYNEEEKLIKKMRMLKQCDSSGSVLHDEKYYLSDEVFLWKCHSPKLYPTIPAAIPVATPPPPPPPPPPVTSAVAPTTQVMTPVIAVPTPGGHITLSLQQLQSLLTANQAKTVQHPPGTKPAYPCMWNTCQESFDDTAELSSHITQSNHIFPESDGNYYCYWSHCSRNKSLGGKPFDTLQKITRHVKEVHLLRIHTQPAPVLKSLPQPTIPVPLIKDINSTNTPPSIPIPAVNVTPTPTTNSLTHFHESSSSIPRSNIATTSVPVTPALTVTPQQAVTTASSAVAQNVPHSDSLPSIFVAPPPKRKQIYHSKLYLNHIERMRGNESTLSPMPPARPLPLSVNQEEASQWIDPSVMPQGMTPTEAINQLYHHMINESVKISNWLDNAQ